MFIYYKRQMMKYNKEATDENILNTIANDTFHRSVDVESIISFIETIEGNAFISLDSAWGEGKTFLVRQIEMTLNYHRKKYMQTALQDSTPRLRESVQITAEEQSAFDKNKLLGNLKLQNTYLPIYFDAWLYDNQESALLALLLIIVRSASVNINTKLPKDFKKSLAKLFSSITFWKRFSYKKFIAEDFDFEKMVQALEGQDILANAYTLEEIRNIIKTALIDAVVENAQKLVIFIDEMDRCRPTFAVELLESIKHYFEDDRIIFFISTNKAQLVHTISRYYGNDFDSSRYLNKFFDINLQLPLIDRNSYLNSIGFSTQRSDWMIEFADELQTINYLSLRDCSNYFSRIFAANNSFPEERRHSLDYVYMLIIMVPIICLFEIIDPVNKQRIINGDGLSILKNTLINSTVAKDLICQFAANAKLPDINFDSGFEIFSELYLCAFGNPSRAIRQQYQDRLSSHFKNICLKLCNAEDSNT